MLTLQSSKSQSVCLLMFKDWKYSLSVHEERKYELFKFLKFWVKYFDVACLFVVYFYTLALGGSCESQDLYLVVQGVSKSCVLEQRFPKNISAHSVRHTYRQIFNTVYKGMCVFSWFFSICFANRGKYVFIKNGTG